MEIKDVNGKMLPVKKFELNFSTELADIKEAYEDAFLHRTEGSALWIVIIVLLHEDLIDKYGTSFRTYLLALSSGLLILMVLRMISIISLKITGYWPCFKEIEDVER